MVATHRSVGTHAPARRVRGGGLGLLGEHEQHAQLVVGERAGGLRDKEGAGVASPERVGVVHPYMDINHGDWCGVTRMIVL